MIEFSPTTRRPVWKSNRLLRLAVSLAVPLCFAQSSQSPDSNLLLGAEKQLFAARYKVAAQLYREALRRDPAASDAYYGLVRALIADHRSGEAYAAAEEALLKTPQTAGTQAAAGLAVYRKGDLAKAEAYFRSALKLDPGHPGALKGLAAVSCTVSQFKTARDLLLFAYRRSPDDPELMLAHAGTLEGAEHVAALQKALSALDPQSREARGLRAHIADDLAIGDRKVRRLVSPYTTSRIKLFRIFPSPKSPRGVGLSVQLNQRRTVQLLLDTGASGISVSPKAAESAGLEQLGDPAFDTGGIGDEGAQASHRYMASELRAGEVVFADYPVSVFRSAKTPNVDGIIGADVFARFIVTIDFPNLEITLEPRPGSDGSVKHNDIADAGPAAAGFHRVFRFGNHLAVPTSINGGAATLFLLDSGSDLNLLDTEVAGQSSHVHRDDVTRVGGIQGRVKEVSRAHHVSLVFAGFRQQSSELLAFSLEKMSDSMGVTFGGIIGMTALGQLKSTIDYREGTVRLEYRK